MTGKELCRCSITREVEESPDSYGDSIIRKVDKVKQRIHHGIPTRDKNRGCSREGRTCHGWWHGRCCFRACGNEQCREVRTSASLETVGVPCYESKTTCHMCTIVYCILFTIMYHTVLILPWK